MKKKEIIDKILQYHPNIEHYHGCDEYKSGFEEEKCTGIVSALVPTMEVLKKSCRTWLQSFGCSRTNLLSDTGFPRLEG